ncbi:hypothetical protein KP79_PYT01354 [Mizuhopecten yessoensis]|uniref:Transcriptional coactivator p15 (PC4) C-terminal domain-containing protein n=1 Tax=Mizuhopecten yessoensis TaxID=6573 RepID=A0A210QEE3_MIZYE|nr:hypothetical protein KP79_PYT01354 [Mizuhopecten yessoensis]
MTTRCNLELGGKRFVQVKIWKDELRIDDREWEADEPTKKGTSLPLSRWKMLTYEIEKIDAALAKELSTHLGGNVRVNNPCGEIRQLWTPPDRDDLGPTRKGICLRPTEYKKLKDVVRIMGDVVPEHYSLVPFPEGSHEPTRVLAMSGMQSGRV